MPRKKHARSAIAPLNTLDRRARSAIASALAQVEEGRIQLSDADGERSFGRRSETFPTDVKIVVRAPRFYRKMALGGQIGAAESYMDGDWTCDDLATLFRVLCRNETTVFGVDRLAGRATRLLQRGAHAIRRNSVSGSRQNIAAHYDLGNEFYGLFLDDSLSYSCALFETPNTSIEDAQQKKYERICQKLELVASDHLVEIGSGWGAMAIYAAKHFACRVTTITVSAEQHKTVCERIAREGLEDRVEVRLEDYRQLRGRYDKLVSIEMIEAVGHHYLPTYFKRCSDLLRPGGLMCLQVITTPDQRYDFSRKCADFIKTYIFPGGQLPSHHAMLSSTKSASDLRLIHLEEIGGHYAETLRRWRETFHKNLESIRALGYSESFLRMWEYYLACCEGAFEERFVGTAQLLFAKPSARRTPILGTLEV